MLVTFIGTSNLDVADVVRDATGNRRFLQINTRDDVDFEALSQIDTWKIWRSIDEDALSPYAAGEIGVIREAQAGQRHKDAVSLFLDDLVELCEATFQPATVGGNMVNLLDGKSRRTSDWWDAFREWLDRMEPGQVRFWNKHKFGKRMVAEIQRGDVPVTVGRTAGNTVFRAVTGREVVGAGGFAGGVDLPANEASVVPFARK